jgi:hypothetical protein
VSHQSCRRGTCDGTPATPPISVQVCHSCTGPAHACRTNWAAPSRMYKHSCTDRHVPAPTAPPSDLQEPTPAAWLDIHTQSHTTLQRTPHKCCRAGVCNMHTVADHPTYGHALCTARYWGLCAAATCRHDAGHMIKHCSQATRTHNTDQQPITPAIL